MNEETREEQNAEATEQEPSRSTAVRRSQNHEWNWLSPNSILHAYHKSRNSVTACGLDWNGYNYIKYSELDNVDKARFTLCKNCMRTNT